MTSHLKLLAAGQQSGWQSLADADCSAAASRSGQADEWRPTPLLLYFTSGTTAKPKLVQHTHASYPVGHLTTMYWLGLRAGRRASEPEQSRLGEACLELILCAMECGSDHRGDADSPASTPRSCSSELVRCEVTTFCAPPTVWRALIQLPLKDAKVKLRELLSAGEPLNPGSHLAGSRSAGA